jgi:mRNA interferase MazF
VEPSSAGTVVLVPFPFSDLSQSKLRPAIVLAAVGREDYILCQVTSNPFADPRAIELTEASFVSGSLHRTSYARPGKLFTAHRSLIRAEVGTLSVAAFGAVRQAVIALIQVPGV